MKTLIVFSGIILAACTPVVGSGIDRCFSDEYITAYEGNPPEQLKQILVHNESLAKDCR